MKRLLIAWVLACSLGCTSLNRVGMVHAPTFVVQQTPIDCAIAALAMAADTTYQRADQAREQLGVHLEDFGGTPFYDVVAIAGRLGVHLVPIDQVNFVTDEGIVIVVSKTAEPEKGRDGVMRLPTHAVYLLRGLVYDPDDTAPAPWVMKFEHWAQLVVFLQKR